MELIHKFYSEDLRIRASAVIATNVVQEICDAQKAFPLATMALGRLLVGTLLMASQQSENQKVGVRMAGNGPLEELFAEASYECEMRGYCANPHVDPPRKNGHLDLPAGIGIGLLTVSRSLPFQKEPHMGIVPIVSGEIAEDLSFYLQQSHQVASILSLAVSLTPEGRVAAAGGVLIELMPESPESLIATLEEKAKRAIPLSHRLLAKESPESLVLAYAHDTKLVAIEHAFPLTFSCRCSLERVERTLLLLGKAALAEMVLKGKSVPVNCEFCNKNYVVTIDTLRELVHTVTA